MIGFDLHDVREILVIVCRFPHSTFSIAEIRLLKEKSILVLIKRNGIQYIQEEGNQIKEGKNFAVQMGLFPIETTQNARQS